MGIGADATYTYNIGGNTWDTTTFAARSAAHAAGSIACPSFFLRPDAAKQARHSYVYVFRGGNVATLDLFDIAGGATGAWTAAITYGGSGMLFTTGTTMTPDPYTGGGRFAFINPNGGQRCLKWDSKNRTLSPAYYLRYPMGTAAVGQRMATAMFVDGTTKLVFLLLQRTAVRKCSRWRFRNSAMSLLLLFRTSRTIHALTGIAFGQGSGSARLAVLRRMAGGAVGAACRLGPAGGRPSFGGDRPWRRDGGWCPACSSRVARDRGGFRRGGRAPGGAPEPPWNRRRIGHRSRTVGPCSPAGRRRDRYVLRPRARVLRTHDGGRGVRLVARPWRNALGGRDARQPHDAGPRGVADLRTSRRTPVPSGTAGGARSAGRGRGSDHPHPTGEQEHRRMTFTKDPDAILDYSVEWSPWLAGDEISSSAWLLEEGAQLEIVSDSKTATSATVWLRGGQKGSAYLVTCRIVTVGGRTDDRSFYVKVEDR